MAQSALLTVMVGAAHKAARSLVRDFGEIENLQVSRKGPADFVSNADRRAEEIIFNALKKARPTYSFLMEEGGAVEGTDGLHRWIVDPLDGTTNFLHSVPVFATAIALERAGEIVASVIYNPIMDELFTAEKGNGAWMNNRRLRVANRRHLADCLLATGIKNTGTPADAEHIHRLGLLNHAVSGVRRSGSASCDLAWLAAGRYDIYWETGLAPWDVAPGLLLLREAGGIVTDLAGGPDSITNGQVVAGNQSIQSLFLKALEKVSRQP